MAEMEAEVDLHFHLRAKADRLEMTLASFLVRRSRASRMRMSSALSVTKQLVAPENKSA